MSGLILLALGIGAFGLALAGKKKRAGDDEAIRSELLSLPVETQQLLVRMMNALPDPSQGLDRNNYIGAILQLQQQGKPALANRLTQIVQMFDAMDARNPGSV